MDHICEVCGRNFGSDKANRQHHTLEHNTDSLTFSCALCGNNYQRRSSLGRHTVSKHTNVGTGKNEGKRKKAPPKSTVPKKKATVNRDSTMEATASTSKSQPQADPTAENMETTNPATNTTPTVPNQLTAGHLADILQQVGDSDSFDLSQFLIMDPTIGPLLPNTIISLFTDTPVKLPHPHH